VALQKGFFARRGFDVEVIQMAAGLVAPALLNRAIDYTTIPSGPATAGAPGAPLKVSFTSVKLQHVLVSRPEISAAWRAGSWRLDSCLELRRTLSPTLPAIQRRE